MGDEATEEHERTLAAPFIFLIVAAFQFAYHHLDQFQKSRSDKENETRLRGEIKQLLKEASSMSQYRSVCVPEKSNNKGHFFILSGHQPLHKQQNSKGWQLPRRENFRSYVTYGVLLIWFWGDPVASISQQLVQPFGRLLSWKSGGVQNNNVMIGIISWLVVSARVCRFVRRAYNK
ncbi:hypothetical protein VNO77_40491 [Canavalia gladiata]|uniref:Uncharacterized protein n=1 Tax=Canavalia gladiata TaxID=3824 RepID=A0AAN9K0Q3_CANGL